MNSELVFYVNGKEVIVRNPDPEINLLSFLRQQLNLTGTKLGCGEGGCGACTVLATKFIEGQARHISLNACLAPLCSMHGINITTVEGVGTTRTKVHPVQEALANAHGSQCGFCTPGFIMSMYGLLCNKSCPQLEDVEQAFEGNLCRCTGYRPILQGFSKLAEDIRNDSKEVKTLNTNPELLEDLKEKTSQMDSTSLHFKSERVDWFRPTDLQDFLNLKHDYPHAKIVVGNTELGIEMKLRNLHYPVLIAATHVPALNVLTRTTDGIVCGASVTLKELERCLETEVITNSVEKTKLYVVILEMLKWFASNQIKNVAAVGGNIMTASPISDLNPLFISASCNLSLISKNDGLRKVPFHQGFFTGYRRTILKPSEILLNIELPYSSQNEFYGAYKQSRRREDDISIVNAAMKIAFNTDDWTIKEAKFVFGGMAPTTIEAKNASDTAIGRNWDDDMLGKVITTLKEELFLDLGIPGGMEAYRSSLVLSLFFKFYVEVRLELEQICPGMHPAIVTSRDVSARHHYHHECGQPSFVQIYDDGNDDEDVFDGDYGNDDDDDGVLKAKPTQLYKSTVDNVKLHAVPKVGQDSNSEFKGQPHSNGALRSNNKSNGRTTSDTSISDDDKNGDDSSDYKNGDDSSDYKNGDDSSDYRNGAGSNDDKNNDELLSDLKNVKTTRNISDVIISNNNLNSKQLKRSEIFNETLGSNDKVTNGQVESKFKAVGRPMVHLSAFKQTTGEAVYVDDMPVYKDELFLSYVLSSKAHAKITGVDSTGALSIPGVVAYIDHSHVQGSNDFGDHPSGHDEKVFAKDLVQCQGQIIGGILSSDRNIARRAASVVRVQYEDLKAILTIKEAIEHNSFHPSTLSHYSNGDPVAAMATADHVIEGEVSIGGQEHFYLEPNVCLAVPLEDGGAEVFISSQHPFSIQEQGCKVLGVDQNKIHVRVLRLGGGFGGKEVKPIAVAMPCLVAAQKFNKPVRCVLDRDDDMSITAGRHPFLGRYKVGFTKTGKIVSAIINLYSNCGCTFDHSQPIMDRSVSHAENSYNIPNILVKGYLCKTNLPSNTAFRGFGAPQGIFVCESYVKDVADYLGLPAYKVKEINMYKEGDMTPYKQLLENFTLQKCWNQVIQQSDFHSQLKEVELFNSQHRWKKRGVSLMPLKYGCGFALKSLNQGGALVNVYRDGSVLLSHGGTEMGQGLFTKMIQVASQVLKIPASYIHTAEANTKVIPNASSTAASFASDLNGMAVLRACKTLMERLKPVMEKYSDKGWRFWIEKAYEERINLSAAGFFKSPNYTYNKDTNSGNKYFYFSFASACSMVEIDCLTGDHKVLRTDIVMDVGRSLNPAIDVGQIEGGFLQGYGLYTLEELKYSPTGTLYTRGPGAYKIPSLGDIPRTFNVTLLKNCPNPKAVYSSKAVGEPPLLTSLSVFEAIKEAIQSARKDAGIKETRFRLDSPATCERIRMACSDRFTKLYDKIPGANYKPWFIN